MQGEEGGNVRQRARYRRTVHTVSLYMYLNINTYVPGKSIWMSIPRGTVTSHRQSVGRLTLPGKPGLVTAPRVLNTAPPHPGPRARYTTGNVITEFLFLFLVISQPTKAFLNGLSPKKEVQRNLGQ